MKRVKGLRAPELEKILRKSRLLISKMNDVFEEQEDLGLS